MLQVYSETLIINSTHKINMYDLQLLIITEITVQNTSFYVVFKFTDHKVKKNYIFLITQLRRLYIEQNLPNSQVIMSDAEQVLQNVIFIIFLKTASLLCIWHININVLLVICEIKEL